MGDEMSVFRLMEISTLAAAIRDLERVASQPGFEYAPQPTREFYLQSLDRARAEIERRRT